MTESDRVDTEPPVPGPVPGQVRVASTDDSTDPDVQVGSDAGVPLGSRYLLHERLGRGATGTVYRATCQSRPDESTNGGPATGDTAPSDPDPAEVAVKVLREDLADDPDVVARFVAERTTLVELDHPNLVRVRDLVVEGSTLAIVMDLVDGPDLRRWMRTAPALPPAVGSRLLAQIAGALDAVHAAGVVHRDLKPENVLLSRVGTSDLRTHLTDFGLALPIGDAAACPSRPGPVAGTPAYLAPEVTAGTPAGAPADIYALGVLAYELLAGCRPFTDEQPSDLAHAHATLTPGRPLGIDDELWRVLASCLAKDPADRPTADALAASLLDCAGAIGDDAPPIPRQKAPPPARPAAGATGGNRRRRVLWTAIAAAAAAVVVAGWAIGVLPSDQPDQPDQPADGESQPGSAPTTQLPGPEQSGADASAESTTTRSPTTTQVPAAPLQVPNVVGLDRTDACAALEEAHLGCSWVVNPTDSVRDPALADDQSIAAGTSVDPDATVTVSHPAGPDAVLHRYRATNTTTAVDGDLLRRWALAPDAGPGRHLYDQFQRNGDTWEPGGEVGRCYSTQVEGSVPLHVFTTPTPRDPEPDHHFYTAGPPGSANFERARRLYPQAERTALCYVVPWDAPSGGTEVIEWTRTDEVGRHFYSATGEGEGRLDDEYTPVEGQWRTW